MNIREAIAQFVEEAGDLDIEDVAVLVRFADWYEQLEAA